MFGWSRWPFYPGSLSEVIEPNMLAVIETGSSERMQRPLTILDFDPATQQFTHRIESIDEMRRYEDFCRCLRRTNEGNDTCLGWDLEQAKISLAEFQRTDDPFRCFPCHMNLVDMTYIIQLFHRPVALLFTGQYCPAQGSVDILEAVEGLQEKGLAVDNRQKELLRRYAREIQPLPENAREQLEREANSILHFAESEFRLKKHEKEQVFLDGLRMASSGAVVRNREDLIERMEGLLGRLRRFVHCHYLLFFSAVQEKDTVLSPLASDGLPEEVDRALPHFNWRKANLPLANFDLNGFKTLPWTPEARARGIRGEHQLDFQDAALIIPVSLGDRYRGALVFGPFQEGVDLALEERFLKEAASAVATFCLACVQVIALEQERSRWRNTARLLTHQFKTALTPITTTIGRTRYAIQKPSREIDFQRLDALLRQAEDLSMQLADSARETLSGSIALTSKQDLHLENCHLSVLVANCAASFIDIAAEQNRELDIDKSVEILPEAEADVPRLTVALQNLIENAIKYSYADTTIRVRSRIDYAQDGKGMVAVIEVDDLGREIRQNERDFIFELGTRGSNVLAAAKAKVKLPGSGLGLWETRSVIEAHGGKISVSCEPTSVFRRDRRAYRVVFSVMIPIQQER